jgi:hypothetical protein
MTIEELQKKMANWRKNKKSHRDRIPQEYWDQAVIFARKSSPSSVARKLGLNTTDLRKKLGNKPGRPKKKITFKEMKAPQALETPLFEISTAAGTTIKVYR